MSEKGLTTIALKKINRSKIYQYIYRSKLTSKLQIVQDLQMGLSTVSQNLNLLENEGLIEKNGYFDSTGGRKANAIQIVSDFRISIGVGILKNIYASFDAFGLWLPPLICTETRSIRIQFRLPTQTQLRITSRSLTKSRTLLTKTSIRRIKFWGFPSLPRELLPRIIPLLSTETL